MNLSPLRTHYEQHKIFYLCLVLCYAFSVLCRLYWVLWASEFEIFRFNNELMIISNDGYVFAEGARDMIAGFHQPNDLSFFGSPLSTLTYYIYQFTPFSFESIILYMSVFLSSLIVVPVLLIARLYDKLEVGIIAALLASIANSYYNRTMAGYFDTDMLVIVVPMLLVYCMLRFILKKDALSLICMPLVMMFYLWYYPSSYTLNCTFIALFAIYTLIFHRKETPFYLALVFMLVALANVAWYYSLALLALLFGLYGFKNEWFKLRFVVILGGVVFAFVAFSGGFNAIWYQLEFYIFKSDVSSIAQSFAYFNVSQTIQEVSNISLSMFMQRISASEMTFLLSLLGLILLIKEHKSTVLLLPMLALGFLALRGGLRFTIYAVPVMALGFGYFVVWFLEKLQKIKQTSFAELFSSTRIYQLCFFICALFFAFCAFYFRISFFTQLAFLCIFGLIFIELLRAKFVKALRYFVIFIALFFSVGYALVHIYHYKASSVFYKDEVKILSSLQNIADREDYVVAWWDYGYPIRYYSDVKTLVDGGKHLGKFNFFPSFVMSFNQTAGANMARLAVEYTEKSFYDTNDSLLQTDLLKAMMRDYGYNDGAGNETLFLNALNSPNFKLKTPKTRDVFLYMPLRMAMIFPTVASFSKIDLHTGNINKPFVFTTATALAKEKGFYLLSNGMHISEDFTQILINDKAFNIHSFVEFTSIKDRYYDDTIVNRNGHFYVFFIKENLNLPLQFIIMDESMFNSAFVQMFFFENYDKNLFELIINEKDAKIYKLKR